MRDARLVAGDITQPALGRHCARFGRNEEAIGWLDTACSLLRSTAGDMRSKRSEQQESS